MADKIKTALEFLKEGKGYKINSLRLEIPSPDKIEVTGWSAFINLSSLSRAIALRELSEVKMEFDQLLESSAELKAFVADRSIQFNLWYDDAGKGSAVICSEENGVINWSMELKKE
jgi:hypothetical protein